jgi:hypothetical protein
MPDTLLIHRSCEVSVTKNLKELWSRRNRVPFAFEMILFVLAIVLFTHHLNAKSFDLALSIPKSTSGKSGLRDQNIRASLSANDLVAYTIKGTVHDSLTGEPLPFAAVYIKELNIGAQTDMEGTYLIKIADNIHFDSLIVHVLFAGYYPNQILLRRKQLVAGGIFFYNFNMVERPLVSIPPPGPYYDTPRIKPLIGVVSKEEIEGMPVQSPKQFIKGVVRDSITNEPMIFVVIKLMNTNITVCTDFNGYYQLNIPDSVLSDPLVFIISCVGYEVPQFEVKKEELPLVKDIYLKPLDTSLNRMGGEKSRKQLRRERRQLRRDGFIIYPD